MAETFNYRAHISWMEDHYFNDTHKTVQLAKGDVLLEAGQENHRMYFIKEGVLAGYLKDREGNKTEVFRSTKGMMVGVYSFFSIDHKSYSTVIAEEDARLNYIDSRELDVLETEVANHFLPVVVNEIYLRQKWAQKMNLERQSILKRLFQNEKMVMLGQMAAGLAHELNNAIALIERKSDWLRHWMNRFLPQHTDKPFFRFFSKYYKDGHSFSTAEIRKRKRALDKKTKLSPELVRCLASMDISEKDARHLSETEIRAYHDMMSAGLAFRDIEIATQQAAHVVSSVKELGLSRKVEARSTDVAKTIQEALALARPMIRQENVEVEIQPLPEIMALPGDLVQVWLNLIKNALEALQESDTHHPTVKVVASSDSENITVQIFDNGPGIPEEYLSEIFHPNVTTKVHGLAFGLGLGLTLVQRIVTAYNGEISVSSEPGHTTFTVCVPLLKPKE